MAQMKNKNGTVQIYTDGSAGGRIAWLRQDTQEQHIEDMPGLTNNEAEYKAIMSALASLPSGTQVEVLSDSTVCVMQLLHKYRVLEPRLVALKQEILALVAKKKLAFTPVWVSRRENRAGKLLE
jgi:ribonuclease HI